MARPNKIGVEYFPFDVDFFNDEKIGAISGEFGIKGELACIKLLCAIYRQGYFILWSEMLQMKLIKELPGVSATLLNEIVSRLIRWNFFDKDLFDKSGILTSKGIQRRYFEITKRREKNSVDLPYLLVSVNNNQVSAYRNTISDDINVCNNSQSKVKESKVNKKEKLSKDSKKKVGNVKLGIEAKKAEQVNKLAAAKAATKKRKEEFYKSLIPYVERYGPEMIRSFFDYWSEMTKSETKMKFELNETWEVAKRLATWNRNNLKDEQKRINSDNGNNRSNKGCIATRTNSKDARTSLEHLGNLCDAILQQPSPDET